MTQQVQIKSTFVEAGPSMGPSLFKVLNHWNRIRGARWAPSLAEFSLDDLDPDIVPFINITDITPEPLASRYRYWGTALTTAFGGDFTGRSPIEVPPRAMGLSARGGCGRMVQEKAPHCEIKRFDTPEGYRGRAVVLRLPLSADGRQVSNGLGVYAFEHVDPGAELATFFEEVFGPLDRQTAA